jgi:hypothetical protein
MEQPHADQPPVVKHALDDVSVQLELGDYGGREVNPASAELGKRDRLVAGLAQALQQPLLLDVSKRHRRFLLLGGIGGASACSLVPGSTVGQARIARSCRSASTSAHSMRSTSWSA